MRLRPQARRTPIASTPSASWPTSSRSRPGHPLLRGQGPDPPARRGVARSYSRRDRARLKLILRGKNLGFSLEEIAQYLKLYDADPAQIAQTQMLLARVETAIEDLQIKRADLDRTLRELKEIRAQCVEH